MKVLVSIITAPNEETISFEELTTVLALLIKYKKSFFQMCVCVFSVRAL
jgi:hypothetical protein